MGNKIVCLVVFIFCISLSVCIGGEKDIALSGLKGVFVILKLNDRSPQGMRPYKERISRPFLLEYLKNDITERFRSRPEFILFRPGAAKLVVKIIITGNRSAETYSITTEASLRRETNVWDYSCSDYWNEKKYLDIFHAEKQAVKRAEIKLEDDKNTYRQIRGMPYDKSKWSTLSSYNLYLEISLNEQKERLEKSKEVLSEAKARLKEAIIRRKITYTIKQTLSTVVDQFFNDYVSSSTRCQTTASDVDNRTFNNLYGTWISAGYECPLQNTENIIVLRKSRELDDNQYGLIICRDGKLTERNNAGWCGTPPITYKNYEGEWKKLSNNLLKITVGYWGGTTSYQMEIVSLSDDEMRISIHKRKRLP
ncbi:MAG: hypothetical protein GY941_20210 [Planctomycetes bacterium]|nr:hypothetical protein [Planctomycetota bacterium]